jgi:hypothetical protein
MVKSYRCKYCGNKISEYDFREYNGYCGKCREVIDWKKILEGV